jgi:hypothetical protein
MGNVITGTPDHMPSKFTAKTIQIILTICLLGCGAVSVDK